MTVPYAQPMPADVFVEVPEVLTTEAWNDQESVDFFDFAILTEAGDFILTE